MTYYLNFCDPADDGDWPDIRQARGPFATLAMAKAARELLPPGMERISITDQRGNVVHDDGSVARY
jgi:hypothetical protein